MKKKLLWYLIKTAHEEKEVEVKWTGIQK